MLVNPIRDGLNLVAKEAALVNDRDGVLVLSPEAGAWDELADVVVPCHPYDVGRHGRGPATGRCACDGDERAERCRPAGGPPPTARTPADWLADNLAAAG